MEQPGARDWFSQWLVGFSLGRFRSWQHRRRMVARAKSDAIIIKGGSYLSFEIEYLILEYINSNIVVVKRILTAEGVDYSE